MTDGHLDFARCERERSTGHFGHEHLYRDRHPGEGRDLDGALQRHGEIPAFAGMTERG
jgi:hypothetical protein